MKICPCPWLNFDVKSNGDIHICENIKDVVGNINECKLDDVLKSKILKRLRKDHVISDLNDTCKDCLIKKNIELFDLVELLIKKELYSLIYDIFIDIPDKDWFLKTLFNKIEDEKKYLDLLINTEIILELNKEISKKFPHVITVEVSNSCNLDCIMCKLREWDKYDPGLMKLDDFKTIIDKIESSDLLVDHLRLFWTGEPTLNPEFSR